MILTAWLPGQPHRVTHQSGLRSTAHGRHYKSKQLLAWEAKLADMLRPYRPDQPIDGPVLLKVTWGFKAQRKGDLYKWKLTRPDTDNMQKTIKDVMTDLGFWHDDAQVVFEICKKVWVDNPGIVVRIETLGGTCEDWNGDNKC